MTTPARWRWTPAHMRVDRRLYRGSKYLARAWRNLDHSWGWQLAIDLREHGVAANRSEAEAAAKSALKKSERGEL